MAIGARQQFVRTGPPAKDGPLARREDRPYSGPVPARCRAQRPMIDQRQEGTGRKVAEPTKGKKRLVARARPSEVERRALELAESERQLRANARTALAEAREVLADTREDLKRTRAALESARRSAESRAVEVTEAERRLRRAREEVEREVRARTSAEAKLERARFQIEKGKTELRAAHERLVQAHGRVKPRAARRIADLRADLAAAREACDAESKRRAELEREVGTRTAEIETLRGKSAAPANEAPADSVEGDDPNEESPETEPDVPNSASAPEPSSRRVSRNGDQFAAIVDTDLGPRERRRARAALEALLASLDGEVVVGLALGRDDNGDCLMAVTDGGLRIIGLEGGDRGRVPYERITSVDCHHGRFGRLRLRVASDDGEILVVGWAERVGRIDYKVRNYLWKKTVERTT